MRVRTGPFPGGGDDDWLDDKSFDDCDIDDDVDGDDIDNSSSIDDGGSDECCSDDGTFDNDVVPAPLLVCNDDVPAPPLVCNNDDESFDDKSHNDCGIDDNVDEVGVGNNFDFDGSDGDDR